MNERIFQLAKQAEIKFEAHLQHLGIDTAVITPADLEKFAELIVKKCADMVESSSLPDAYSEPCLAVIAEEIKEHFGVE
jgi:hypothetical protein